MKSVSSAMMRRLLSSVAVIALVAPVLTEAQESDPVVAPEVIIEYDLEEGEAPEDRTVSVERIRLDERAPGVTISEVLDEVAGLRVRRLGGLEAASTASIRGSTGAQVLVMHDGFSLGAASGLEVNLAEIPAEFFEEVHVYRGPSAAYFGSGALGGVINLIPRRPQQGLQTRLDIGLGSFMPGSWDPRRFFSFSALRRVGVHTLAGLGRFSLLASAGFFDTEGDFVFLNDQGTRLVTDDDTYQIRENNEATQWDVMLQGNLNLRRGYTMRFSEVASNRNQGMPGYGAALAHHAWLRTVKSLTTVDVERTSSNARFSRWRGRFALRLRRDEWFDQHGEVGRSNNHDDDLILDVFGQMRAVSRLSPTNGSIWMLAELRYQEYFARRLLREEDWGWRRTTGSVSTWITWPFADGLFELSPQFRLDINYDSPVGTGPPQPGVAIPEATTDEVISEQLGFLVHPTEWLTFRTSAGLTQRLPTFLELFGDRGAVVANPDLEPESGASVDGGFLVHRQTRTAVREARLEVTGFYRYVEDLIQFVPNSQVTFISTNLGASRVAGVEATGNIAFEWTRFLSSPWSGFIRLRMALTFMEAVDVSGTYSDGSVLPLRPRWEMFARLAFSYGPFELAYELDAMTGNFLDAANFYEVPRRLFHTAELSVDLRRWRGPRVSIVARNLTNSITQELPIQAEPEDLIVERPVADVMGFPLPGLTVFLNVRWDLDLLRSGRSSDDVEGSQSNFTLDEERSEPGHDVGRRSGTSGHR